jgi:aromatase
MEDKFQYGFQEKLIINQPINIVYKALHKAEEWPKHLPHVVDIKMLYDDGEFQEFLMSVRSTDNNMINVRSIRRCNNSDFISYFQPTPPDFLKNHMGSWKLTSIDDSTTEVVATHKWNVNTLQAKVKFPLHKGAVEQQVETVLREHAKFALDCWKQILEREAAYAN